MLPKAHLHHELPLRFRLYIPSKKGDEDFFKELSTELKEGDDVDSVQVNPKTGSVVIHHHGETAKIVQFAKNRELFLLETKASVKKKKHHGPSKKLFGRLKELNHGITTHSDGKIDLGFITACGLLGLALFQAKNGRLLPPAWTLISQAISVISFGGEGKLSQLELLSEFEEEDDGDE
ncbi:MAG TPA: hypothetical protein VEK06_02575 [Myxococcota bacterium]|nr:hypothetical protein [Myxococcota bacterium]